MKWPERYWSNLNGPYRNLLISHHLHKHRLYTQKSKSFRSMMRLECKSNRIYRKMINWMKNWFFFWFKLLFFSYSPIKRSIFLIQKSNAMQIATIHKIIQSDGKLLADFFWVEINFFEEIRFRFLRNQSVGIGLRIMWSNNWMMWIWCQHYGLIFCNELKLFNKLQ